MSSKKSNTDIGFRIREVREQKDLTQQEFAESLGIAQGFLSELESAKYQPSKALLLGIAYLYKINLNWLTKGEGKKENESLFMAADPEQPYIVEQEQFIFIPQVAGKICAGGGLIPDNTIEMRIAFRRDWIHRKGRPEDMSLIRVIGDSMEPTLQSGDIVLIDHGRNFIDSHGGIYAIVSNDEIMLKRLQVLYPSAKIRVISDNPRYEAMEIDQEKVQINGKVIWFGRELER